MELRHLRSFIAATQLQSFTKAASVVGLTQAAVSQHVAALEKELGIELFLRTGRSVVPSEAGRSFYVSVHQALEILENGVRRTRELQIQTNSCTISGRVAS